MKVKLTAFNNLMQIKGITRTRWRQKEEGYSMGGGVHAVVSEGIRQSARVDRAMLPTLGPSGMQLRLNCWLKKRRMNFCRAAWSVSLG